MLVSDYVKKVKSFFVKYENKDEASKMMRYMKNQFPFLGITAPRRRELFKNFFNTFPIPDYDDTKPIIRELFNLPEREFHYFALQLYLKHKKKWSPTDIVFIESLILTKSWWDTVDIISTKIVPKFFEKYPNLMIPITESWNSSKNIWLKRTAIVFQVPYKEKTNLELLTKFILDNSQSSEFFIQKAIGWALRDYSKTDHKWVLRFVINNPLKPLSKREAIKWIDDKGLID